MGLALALAACASRTPAPGAALVQDNDVSQVRACTYLKDLSSTKGWWYGLVGRVSGQYAQTALEDARARVLRQATALGATHIVWLPNVETSTSLRVSAKAYRCRAQDREHPK